MDQTFKNETTNSCEKAISQKPCCVRHVVKLIFFCNNINIFASTFFKFGSIIISLQSSIIKNLIDTLNPFVPGMLGLLYKLNEP